MSIASFFGMDPSQGIAASQRSLATTSSTLGKGYKKAQGFLEAGQTGALGALDTSVNQALPYYQAAVTPFQDIYGQYAEGQPTATLLGALGLGGPEQTQAAREAFTASPWYDYTLGQGIEGFGRVGATTGQLGQANMDAIEYARNLANTDYQDWLNRLQQAGSAQYTAATGLGQAQQGVGGLFSGLGTNKANIYGQFAPAQANTASSYFSSLANAQAAQAAQQQAAINAAKQNSLSGLFGIGSLLTAPLTGGGSTIAGGIGSLLGLV